MDDLQLIREFRADVPQADPSARAAARERLAARLTGRVAWWRRRAVVLAAAALLAVIVAGTAVAFGDRLVDLIRGKPAPSTFIGPFPAPFSDFSEKYANSMKGAPPAYRELRRGFTVPDDGWRGVFALRTSYGPVGLWAGTSRNGSRCWAYVFFEKNAARPVKGYNFTNHGCGPQSWRPGEAITNVRGSSFRFPAVYAALGTWVPGDGRSGDPGDGSHAPRVLYGRAARGVREIEITLEDGESRRLKVWDTFFAGELPWGSVPRELRAYGATGGLVATERCTTNGGSLGRIHEQPIVNYACGPLIG